MLSREDVVEVVALRRRGWSISAIARHTGRDRKTVRAWLRGERARRPRAPSVLEPFREYVARRFEDDPHLDATVLLRELRSLGFERSYPTLTRELRRLELRPECPVCRRGGHRLTVELVHEPGEELQLDWLELRETPWGEPAYVLIGALSWSGRIRAVVCEGMDFARLAAALDRLLRRLGGTARSWRTDRMTAIVDTVSGRLRPEGAELAKHYGVTVAICPKNRPQRKGVVEAAVKYARRSWWRTARVASPAEAQASLDRWCVEVSDRRRRCGQTIAALAAAADTLKGWDDPLARDCLDTAIKAWNEEKAHPTLNPAGGGLGGASPAGAPGGGVLAASQGVVSGAPGAGNAPGNAAAPAAPATTTTPSTPSPATSRR